MTALGTPRLHLRQVDSTNLRARQLAAAGAPHGTLVTANEQLTGRGRQGRAWDAPAGQSLLMSLVIRQPPRLLSLLAGAAVAATTETVGAAGTGATVKWPNDVLIGGRKVAGILVEGRPADRWAVLGIGLNVALRVEDLPAPLRDRAGTLGLSPDRREAVLTVLLAQLAARLDADPAAVLDEVRARDALLGQRVGWSGGSGVGAGVDGDGRLLVDTGSQTVQLDAGEVHLIPTGVG